MNNLIEKFKSNKLIVICTLFTVVYPLIWSFLGLDTSDTGAYLYWYENPSSEYISLLTYFSVIVGSIWVKLFPNLGLWGLNLLEVFVVWTTAYFTFKLLSEVLGKKIVMIGIVFSVVLTTTYIRIFNFHQLNMLLQVILAYTLFTGFKKDQDRYFFISGFLIGVAIFVRITTILGLMYLLAVLIYGFVKGDSFKITLNRIKYILFGLTVSIILILFLYLILGVFSRIGNEIVRVNNLGNSKNTDNIYSYSRLLKYFIFDVSYTFALGLFVVFLIVTVSFVICRINLKYSGRFKSLIIGILLFSTSSIFNWLTFNYGIFPNGWAKLSGYTWMLHGILIVCGFLNMFYYWFISKNEKRLDLLFISVLGFASMWLTFVGTGVRLRHVVIGTWILIPLLIFNLITIYNDNVLFLRKYFTKYEITFVKNSSILIFSILFILSSIKYTLTVNMYDENLIWNMDSIIHSKKLFNIRTSKNQANAMDEVVEYFNNSIGKGKNNKLMVFGNSPIFYSILEMESFVHPWIVVPSYKTEQFRNDLELKLDYEKYPIIILNKTNPYYGFNDEGYIDLLEFERKNSYEGKKEILLKFMGNKYKLGFENDYFKVLIPN